MSAKFSAYLQIYNDWSILDHALSSLVGHVDDLVVVDGAYEWMVPYVTALGLDPTRSDKRVYQALDNSGIPYRVVTRVWKNQLEKRIAGYAACLHDYIYRVDADEIFFFDHGAIDRLLAAGGAVGEMTMPTYLAPGWLVSRAGEQHPRQCFFFDRAKVSPELHLNYLWLVLEADTRPKDGQFPHDIFPEPLAFNAHLTAWRTADTSASRTAYYNTNWMRGHGVPWLSELSGVPLANFDRFFQLVPPAEFRQLLDIDRLSLGKTFLEPGEEIVPSGIAPEIEAQFASVYDSFLASLKRHNHMIASRRQACIQGWGTFLDVSTRETRRAVCHEGTIALKYSTPVHTVVARLHKLATVGTQSDITPLVHTIADDRVEIRLVDADGQPGILRQLVEFTAWSHDPAELQHFEIDG